MPARRGAWKRRLLLGALAFVALVACAPFYLGSILRGVLEGQLETRTGARASIRSVAFAWPARLRLRGLELHDAADAPLASVDELAASVELGPLLAGKVRAEISLVYPELHVAPRGAGWNWDPVVEKVGVGANSTALDEDEPGPLPDVVAHVRVADGHVVVHGLQGDTTLTDIAFELRLDGLETPAPFRLALSVRGPEGPGGALTLEGDFQAATDGRIEPSAFAGRAELTLSALELAAFRPALGLLAPLDGLAGRLEGHARLRLGAGLALEGESEITLQDLSVRGPEAGAEPARVDRIVLSAEAAQQGEGAGTQRLELRADSFLTLRYEGRSDLSASGPGQVVGALSLESDLGRLAELARGWVPLVAGVTLQGHVKQSVELETALLDRRPTTAHVRANGAVEGLAARDASGLALDLAELQRIDLGLDGTLELEPGTLRVSVLALHAGPVSCEGNLEATGVTLEGGLPELRTGALHLAADLERLRGTLGQIVDLGALRFGGTLEADATLEGRPEGLDLVARVTGKTLELGPASLASLGGELRATRALDGALMGSGRIDLGALTLSGEPEQAPLRLPSTKLTLALQEDAARAGRHRLELSTDDGALAFELEATSARAEERVALQGTLAVEGDVARLAHLAAPRLPVQADLEGRLHVQGDWRADLAAGELAAAGGALRLRLESLRARDEHGQELPLEALADTTLSLEAGLDARADTAELRALALEASGLALHASGRASGLAAGAVPALDACHLTLEADLARLGPELARVVDLGGWSLDGAPLTLEADLSSHEPRIEAKGRVACAALRLGRAEGAPVELAELGLDYDLGYDTALGSLHLRKASARSTTATIELAGTLNELLDPSRARGAMQLELSGELEHLLGDLGLEPPEAGRHTSGRLRGKLALEGDQGAFRASGRTTIEAFRLELAPTSEGEKPLLVEDPSIVLDYDARVTLPALDVELVKLALESRLARGGAQGTLRNLRGLGQEEVRVEGLSGQLAYVPDRLGPVLAPYLPGKLTGAEEQRVTFTFDGKLRDMDLAALLAGSEARIDLGIGRFTRPEIELGGALVLEAKGEKLLLRGDLGANGGTLQLDGTLDLAPERDPKTPPRSRLQVTAKELRANSGLAPLLALVHPAFGTANLAQGSLDGLIGLDLDLTYDGPLSLDTLEAGWETLPKTPINGSGRLELRGASLKGSPLLGMLTQFGVDATKALDVKPIEFTIQKGRVTYAKPWTWTLSGSETTFTGSVGLDQSLDLAWNLPITDALVSRYGFLSALKGQSLALPLRGTVTKPRLETDDLLKELASKAAKSEIESRLGLGGDKSGDDPASLLTRADQLWGQGKKGEAAALYTRLKDEFKLSLTYALNKDRIKDRAKYKPPQ